MKNHCFDGFILEHQPKANFKETKFPKTFFSTLLMSLKQLIEANSS